MFKNRFDVFARFDADGVPQGGDTGSGGNDSGSNRQGSDPAAAFQRKLRDYDNDAMQFASKLFDENFAYRERARQLQQEIESLKAKALPDDDLKAFEAYKALGTADEVKQGLAQASELQGKLDRLERDATLRTIAESAGYKPSVLARLDATAKAEGRELVYELRDVEQDGQILKVAYVKEAETEKSLSEFATTEWADFLPALAVDAVPQGGQPPSGTRFPAQNPAPAARKQETTKAVAESYVKNTYRRANNGSNRND